MASNCELVLRNLRKFPRNWTDSEKGKRNIMQKDLYNWEYNKLGKRRLEGFDHLFKRAERMSHKIK